MIESTTNTAWIHQVPREDGWEEALGEARIHECLVIAGDSFGSDGGTATERLHSHLLWHERDIRHS